MLPTASHGVILRLVSKLRFPFVVSCSADPQASMAVVVASPLPPLLSTPPRSEMVPILPTPPRTKMLPLLPTPSVVAALVALSSMPGRADFVQRWDAIKKYKNDPCSTISSSSTSSESGGSPSRADSVHRWDEQEIRDLRQYHIVVGQRREPRTRRLRRTVGRHEIHDSEVRAGRQ
jgi:hypothetical protein